MIIGNHHHHHHDESEVKVYVSQGAGGAVKIVAYDSSKNDIGLSEAIEIDSLYL